LNGQHGTDSAPPGTARSIAGLVVANSSLLIAVLVYMGWAYEDALYGYFHVRPLDLGVGVVEYVLRSLSLFSPAVVFAAAGLIAIASLRAWGLDVTRFVTLADHSVIPHVPGGARLQRLASEHTVHQPLTGRALLIGAGAAMTVTAAVLAWVDTARYFHPNTYLVLILLGGGLLTMTWPSRAERQGRFPYALAIVVAAVCGLWAASQYANAVGIGAAEDLVRGLPTRTAVAVYSIQPLALRGPGVTEKLLNRQYLYHYRYTGLRLLITRSGTYYLLPLGWSLQHGNNITYILNDNNQIRIELY
jgi:hypothetical protein